MTEHHFLYDFPCVFYSSQNTVHVEISLHRVNSSISKCLKTIQMVPLSFNTLNHTAILITTLIIKYWYIATPLLLI